MLQDHEPIFGKNVIETLSEGMYDNPLFLFREYVQNSADAIDAAESTGILKKGYGQIVITIDTESRNISFEDNGTGIPVKLVNKMLANIGDSQKDRKSNKGFRGIGRLGGLGYCQKVRFETSAFGENYKSTLEWDAKTLHDILADKDEHMHAGQLIKQITTTSTREYPEKEHFFKVTLVNVNKNSDELLDTEEVRKYLSMVAPVPFDYAKFQYVDDIERFLQEEGISKPNEYQLYLNGDEIRKGYETPLKIEGKKDVDILGVVCRPIKYDDKVLGWYWFCVSRFEGVLPKNCWQRCIRLRKSNIQIGEADCLSNHPKRGLPLWREDRGNNYFIGEIHTLDVDLIPNSRRDYFNQDEACRNFEAALTLEFKNLHDLYHSASVLRSQNKVLQDAHEAKKDFENKEKSGAFYSPEDRTEAQNKVKELESKIPAAQKAIEKTLKKSNSGALKLVADEYTEELVNSYDTIPTKPFKPDLTPTKGYAKDNIDIEVKKVLDVVFEVLDKMLPPDKADPIHNAIIKRFIKK